jgi:hypothetical protein
MILTVYILIHNNYSSKQFNMQTTKCPLCHSDMIIDEEAYEGDLVDCVNCQAEMEIESLHPLKVSVLEPNDGHDLNLEEAGDGNEEASEVE